MARTNFRQSVHSILFWSILAAAFVGPGTVTTSAAAGAAYGIKLVWALLFSIVACMIIQETAARIPLASGKSLGETIPIILQGESTHGSWIKWGLTIAIYVGGVAYQAGNLLGAMNGLKLVVPGWEMYLFLAMIILGSIMLWHGTEKYIAQILGVLVGIMAILFTSIAMLVLINNEGAFTLTTHNTTGLESWFPSGSEAIILGLIGTTIVPYNIFLGSGMVHSSDLSTQRIGIYGAVILGGMLTAAVMIVGTAISGTFSFESLADVLIKQYGPSGKVILGIGLWAAGFTSSLTAPLAAAITAKSMFGYGAQKNRWHIHSTRVRLIWGSIMLLGIGFALTNTKPIPAIILAQALNGLLLPFVVIALSWVINDTRLIPPTFRNTPWANGILYAIVWTTLVIGMRSIWKVMSQLWSLEVSEQIALVGIILLSTMITLITVMMLWKKE